MNPTAYGQCHNVFRMANLFIDGRANQSQIRNRLPKSGPAQVRNGRFRLRQRAAVASLLGEYVCGGAAAAAGGEAGWQQQREGFRRRTALLPSETEGRTP